jgi:hypothetical protein
MSYQIYLLVFVDMSLIFFMSRRRSEACLNWVDEWVDNDSIILVILLHAPSTLSFIYTEDMKYRINIILKAVGTQSLDYELCSIWTRHFNWKEGYVTRSIVVEVEKKPCIWLE